MQQFSSQEMWSMTLQMKKATTKGEFIPWGMSELTLGRWLESIILISPCFGSDLCLLPWFEDTFCGRFRTDGILCIHPHIPEVGSWAVPGMKDMEGSRATWECCSQFIFSVILREELGQRKAEPQQRKSKTSPLKWAMEFLEEPRSGAKAQWSDPGTGSQSQGAPNQSWTGGCKWPTDN